MKKNLIKNLKLSLARALNSFIYGFTLIELLVVVAIIGMLAAVVLASLNRSREKGVDAAIKENLTNARAQAALFYEANGGSYDTGALYHDVCDQNTSSALASKSIYPFLNAAKKASGAVGIIGDGTIISQISPDAFNYVTCRSTADAWAADAPLTGDKMFCVDSIGNAKEETASLAWSSTSISCQ